MALTDPPTRSPVLPRPQVSLVGQSGAPVQAWYDFFRALLTRVDDDATLQAEIEAILARLETLEGSPIIGANSVQTFGSLSAGLLTIVLRNDEAAPNPLYFYGTGPTGVRGYWPAASLVEYMVDESGNYLIDENGDFLISADITADLFAIVGTGYGVLVHTAAGAWQNRSIVSATAGLSVANGNGVAGNISLSLSAPLVTLDGLGTTGQFFRGDGSWSNTIVGPFAVNNGTISITGTQSNANFLFFCNATITNNNTSQQAIAQFQPAMQPQGATLASLFGLLFLPTLSGGSAAITTISCIFSRLDPTAGFTGTIANVFNYRAGNPGAALTVSGEFTHFRADNPSSVTAASVRGLDSMVAAGTGKHNVYAQGTAPNYFRGNVGVNTATQFGTGDGVIGIGNAVTLPTTNPTAGVVIYADAGAAKVRGSGGTVTTFGPANPHCPVCESDFVREYDSPIYGYLARCDYCAANGVNSHTRVRGAWNTHEG